MTEIATPRRPRVTAFWAGVIAGVATMIAVPASAYGLVKWLYPSEPFNFEMVADGAALSRHGGARLTIKEHHERFGPALTAICKGGCDTYGYRQRSGDNSHVVQVLDAQGAVIAEGHDGYVHSRSAVRLRIGGGQALVVERATSMGDGQFTPFAVVSPKTRAGPPPLGSQAPTE